MKNTQTIVQKVIFLAVFITMVASTVAVAVIMALAPASSVAGEPRVKSDYVLMLLQCVVGIVALLLPSLLQKKFGLEIPSRMMIVYAVFLYCSIYLGEVRSFYYLIPHWDNLLHTFSGAMLGALGFSVITLLNRTDRVPLTLSPAFVAVFGFCFAVAVGVVWEVYEFLADGVLGTNMQKFALESGEKLVGRAAVHDTMIDLIVDAVGALVVSVIGYLSLKFKTGWLEKIQLRVNKKPSPPTE